MSEESEYPKIQTLFKREEKTHRLVVGDWSLPELWYLRDNVWIWTEKVNGTNIRVIWDSEASTIIFGGKTEEATIPKHLYAKLAELFPVEKFERLYPDKSMILYGEGYGEKIQKGSRYMPDGHGTNFILFDINIDGWWLLRKSLEDIATKLEIGIVPIVGSGTLNDASSLIKSRTLESAFGKFLAEGLVMKPAVELKTRAGERLITKLKHKDKFLEEGV